jgi:hypothetical protein
MIQSAVASQNPHALAGACFSIGRFLFPDDALNQSAYSNPPARCEQVGGSDPDILP